MPHRRSLVSIFFLTLLSAPVALDQGVPARAGTEATESAEPTPHAQLSVKVEDGVTVSYLKVANEGAPRQTISVEISGFDSDKGVCAVLMSSDKKKYTSIDPRKPRADWIASAATAVDTIIAERKSRFIIKNVPHGEYVFAAFHDVNANQLLDTNRLGIPRESYGFSNGVRWRLRIPKWKLAHIKVDEEHTSFNVQVK